MRKHHKLLSRFLVVIFVITNILILQPSKTMAASTKTKAKINYEERAQTEIIVKYKSETKADSVRNNVKSKLKLSKLETRKSFKRQMIEVIAVDKGSDRDKVIKELKNNPDVLYAQPNYKLFTSTVPTDPRFNEQWGLSNSGQEVEGKTGRSGVDINAINAWNITQGTGTTVVGVLDTGIDINHEDLKDNIYTNSGEIPGNGIDDDGNGYIDDVNGWDFSNDDKTVYDSSETDRHGTYTAGIIAAESNDKGITGVAPGIKILPLKFINGESGYTCDAIEAIEYAMKMGVKIINCSFGGTDDNFALKDAMQNSGILFICAAGNRGGDVSTLPVYPACFNIPNIISVASIDGNGVLAPFSSYGNKISIAAPGTNILSTTPDNTYDYYSGTSVSAPFVTGVAALIKSSLPNSSINDIADRIKNNVVVCTKLQGKVSTNGRVDAYAALSNTVPQADTYAGDGQGIDTIPVGNQGGEDDTWYTQDQLGKIREQLHYGESGVNPASGNYSFTCNDMSVIAPGFKINISRTYNSKDERIGLMGRGWTFGFEGYVTGDDTVTVILPTGSVQKFSKVGNSYEAQDSRSILIKNSDDTFELTTKDRYSYGFNSFGYLDWMRDKFGNTVNIDIDISGMIHEISDTVGRKYIITYNDQFLIENIKDPEDRIVRYEYDQDGYLIKVYDPMGGIMRYSYDSYGFMEKIEDHYLEKMVELKYNHAVGENQHKVAEIIDSSGLKSNYSYNLGNRKTTITDTNGRTWTYWFDTAMYTIKTQDPEGKYTQTQYKQYSGKNKYGDVEASMDRNGNWTRYTLDTSGNITKTTNPDQSYKTFEYDDKNNLVKEVDETGRPTFYIYDSDKKNLVKKVMPLNGTDTYIEGTSNTNLFAITNYEYYTSTEALSLFNCAAGGLTKSITDPEGNKTEFKYDQYGYISEVKDPEGKITRNSYNKIGWTIYTISAGGYRTDYYYDKNGLLEKKVLNGGETTRLVYDMDGRKTKEISPNQFVQANDDLANHLYNGDVGYRYTYYENGNIHTATDPMNNVTTYTYDVYGNTSTIRKPNGSITRYEYDVLNRVKREFFKDNETSNEVLLKEYSYAVLSDGKTQITEIAYLNDTDKATTTTISDYFDRVLEKQNPDGTKTKTLYESNGLIKLTEAVNGSKTYYKYDGFNRLSEQWTPLEISNGNTYYSYIKYQYDKADRKTSEIYGKDKVLLYEQPVNTYTKNYTYYKNWKTKTITDSEGRKTEYQYDNDLYLSRQEDYASATEKTITEYIYNYFGKVKEKKVHVKSGDLEGNDFNSTQDTILFTTYIYDKNANLKTEKTPDNVITTYEYDALNRVVSTSQHGEDEFGTAADIVSSMVYDWEGKAIEKKDAKNNITRYAYSLRGLLVKITDAKGGITAYDYDRGGRKTIEVSPQNYETSKQLTEMSRIEYKYDLMGRLKAKLDIYKEPETAQWITVYTKSYKRDNGGNVIKELDAMGFDSGKGNTIDEKINTGYGTEYTCNLANNIVTSIDAVSKERSLPFTMKYEYDGMGHKISEINAKGVITRYDVDCLGNILEVSVANKTSSSFQTIKSNTYDLLNRVLTQTDGNGNTTSFEYNSLGKLRSSTTPSDDSIPSYIVTSQYDVMGNVRIQEDNMGAVDEYTYDNQNRLISHTSKKSDNTQVITTSTKYDINGNKRFETDGRGTVTENTYDELNRVVSNKVIVNGVEHITTYGYDKNSNVTTATDWMGNTSTTIYDPLNRIIGIRDAYNKYVSKLEYNKNNVQIKSYDAYNNFTSYKYDKNNKLIETVDPEGHKTSKYYDNIGNIVAETDGRNNTTNYSYDEFNRLALVTNARAEKTSYTYDLNGNMLSQTDGKGNVTMMEYNSANKLLRKIYPGGRTGTVGHYVYLEDKVESYTYSADGSVHTFTDRNGNTTEYTYDIHKRMLSETIGSNTISYTYDDNGNELTMTDNTGTTIREYDVLNRVILKTVPNIGETIYDYDIISEVPYGSIKNRTTDPKGNVTEKIIDRDGRLWKVIADGETTTYGYDDNGNREFVEYQSGLREEYTYNKDNLATSLINKKSDGSVIETFSYTYDASHNLSLKTDNKGTTYYTYDPLNRLDSVTEPGGKSTSYIFDKAGNRVLITVSVNLSTVVTSYVYNELNRLITTWTQSGGTTEKTTYAYDDNGNMTSKTTSTIKPLDVGSMASASLEKAGSSTTTEASFYEYNEWNQMIKTIEKDKTVIYAYNAENYRVEKKVNGETTRYLYESDNVILEVDAQNNETARNVYGLNLLSRDNAGDRAYYLYNGHADVTALISDTGNILATYYYDAFGNILEKNEDSGVNNPYRYVGYQYDTETDLYYLNTRYYDSKTARFLSEDTYAGNTIDPLSLNLYTYCQNEPIMYIDPTGHNTLPATVDINGFNFGGTYIDGTTYVWVRDIAGAIGASVNYNSSNGIASVDVGSTHLEYNTRTGVGDTAMYFDNKASKTMVAVRAFINAIGGYIIDWKNDNGTMRINITKESNQIDPEPIPNPVPTPAPEPTPVPTPAPKPVPAPNQNPTPGSTPTPQVTNNDMIDMLINDKSLHLTQAKKDSIINVATTLLNEGYEPAFVAGVLGNILAEGNLGHFEGSNYKSNPEDKPDYLIYADANFNYRNEFSNKNIMNVGIKKTYDLLKKCEKVNYKGKFGLGAIQWTGGRAMALIKCYIKVCGLTLDKDGDLATEYYPTEAQCRQAENMMIINELNGKYYHKRVYNKWVSQYSDKDSVEAAKGAGIIVCKYYEIPHEDSSETRGNSSAAIYKVMMGIK